MNTLKRDLIRAWPLAVVGLVYVGIFGRSVAWGWLGMDDALLLKMNAHLGHSWQSYTWGWLDVDFGRRWMPGLWTIANTFSGAGAVGYHLGTLLLGLALVVSMFWVLRDVWDANSALIATLFFVCSPLRWEIFGWAVGFIYTSVALCCVWAFWCQEQANLSGLNRFRAAWVLLVLVALSIYPQAAGVALVLALRDRRRWGAYVIYAAVVYLFAFQWWLRMERGYVPVQARWDLAVYSFPHYVFAQVVPLSTVPIVPPGFHWGVVLGAVVVAVGAARFPRQVAYAFVIFAPVALAAYSESFWWCGRYATLLSVFVALMVAEGVYRRAFVRDWVAVLAVLALATALHRGFSTPSAVVARAREESQMLYGREVGGVSEAGLAKMAQRAAEETNL